MGTFFVFAIRLLLLLVVFANYLNAKYNCYSRIQNMDPLAADLADLASLTPDKLAPLVQFVLQFLLDSKVSTASVLQVDKWSGLVFILGNRIPRKSSGLCGISKVSYVC